MVISSSFGSKEIIVILVFIAFIVLIGLLTRNDNKKRKKKMEQIALTLGLSYIDKAQDSFLSPLKTIKIFNEGHSRKAYNLMQWKKQDINCSIFDYRYTSGSGQNTATYSQSVFLAQTDKLNITKFSMTPESIFNKIGDKLTKNDIDFDRYTNFSKKYHLKGKDEDAVRKVFTDEILQFFEHRKERVSIEAEGDKIVIYTRSKDIDPKDLAAFKDEALKIVNLFLKNNSSL